MRARPRVGRLADAAPSRESPGGSDPGRKEDEPPYLRIYLLALLVRIALLAPPLPTSPGPASDFVFYAERIAAGNGFGPSALLPPVYPFFLAAIFRLQGQGAHSVALWQAILGALTTIPTLALTRAAGLDRGRVWLAGLLVALFPAAAAEARYATPAPLAALLFAAAAAVLLGARAIPRLRRSVAAGVLLGAALLTRSGVIAAAVPLVLAAPFARRTPGGMGPHGEAGMARAFILALAILVTVPWSVRNGRMHERPALTETTWALRLRAATIPGASPFLTPDAAREARLPDNLVLSDNSLALWETTGYVLRHPARAAGLWLSRSGRLLSPLPSSDARGADPVPHRFLAFRAAHAVAWSVLVTLLLSWLILLRSTGAIERALLAAALGFGLAGVLTGALADARLLALPLLAGPAARGATGVGVWGKIGKWRVRAFLLGSSAVWVLAALGLLSG